MKSKDLLYEKSHTEAAQESTNWIQQMKATYTVIVMYLSNLGLSKAILKRLWGLDYQETAESRAATMLQRIYQCAFKLEQLGYCSVASKRHRYFNARFEGSETQKYVALYRLSSRLLRRYESSVHTSRVLDFER
jgi:hypothetical protein